MAAQEWWDTVKHEVRDMLVPGQARRMTGAAAGGLEAVKRQPDSTTLPTVINNPFTTTGGDAPTVTQLVVASTSSRTTTPTTTHAVVHTPTTTTSSIRLTATPTTTAAASEPETGGLSVAAKAGIVIGALGAVLILFVIIYFIVSGRRKKLVRRRQQIEDDEKINGPFADSAAIRPLPKTPNKAPRLSLRPVTQFLPNFSTQSQADRRASRGIALTLNPVSNAGLNRPTGGSAWERSAMRAGGDGSSRPDTSASLYPTNPFHDKHRLPDEPVSPVSSMGSFDRRVGLAKTSDSIPEPVSPIFGDDDDDDDNRDHGSGSGSGGHLGVSSLTRKTSIRKDIPKPLDLTKPPSPLYAVPPSPAGTEYSMHSMAPGQSPGPSASAAAIAAAGGPSQSTVHRVQLDFKPTLQDEMGLRAGQLVRLLHEYDDGWALCILLDRSQQGVVPRTCLSTRPVKPRPQQGPQGGNQRGGPPINPSYHQQHQYQNSSGGVGYGRPRSPGGYGGNGQGSRRGNSPLGWGDEPGQAY
ncbi:hypothetical protein C8A05DRAFT_33264 [Staphylotrichum tortipilum]|uniref:SH3 domain-containing protein n=1 Tax=Staphylotrichum tortipilum TaxID=2831512 RepID=A0AAN6RUA5_9PEZI|nr:hypothetical protein C8A05DRAFT_33264 [Staphylotrichum longicolle]